MSGLLHVDRLFQALLTEGLPDDYEVAADLDVDSIDFIPFITHRSFTNQTGNADGLWSVTLSVRLFTEAASAFDSAATLYDVIHAWAESPTAGILPGIGGIEQVEDSSALARVVTTSMMNKFVTQYDGTFQILVKKL